MVKNLPASAGDLRDMSLHWVRGWQPAPEFLPGNPHGQRSLMGSTESTHPAVWPRLALMPHRGRGRTPLQVVYGFSCTQSQAVYPLNVKIF